MVSELLTVVEVEDEGMCVEDTDVDAMELKEEEEEEDVTEMGCGKGSTQPWSLRRERGTGLEGAREEEEGEGGTSPAPLTG